VNKECAAIARRSYEAGFNALRPGITFGKVVEAMEEPLNQARAWYLTPLIHSLNPHHWISGVAVGIENLPGIERYKGVGRTPVIGADLVIQAGTVWELEPNVCIGKHKVDIGGTVIVTKEGATALNVLSTQMRIIG
jgi:Xaa-Pro aminopeptidase